MTRKRQDMKRAKPITVSATSSLRGEVGYTTNGPLAQTETLEVLNRSRSENMLEVVAKLRVLQNPSEIRRIPIADRLAPRQSKRVDVKVLFPGVQVVEYGIEWKYPPFPSYPYSTEARQARPGYYFLRMRASIQPDGSSYIFNDVQKAL